MVPEINEHTRIPLFTVITVIPFFVVGIVWVAGVDSTARSARDEVTTVKIEIVGTKDLLIDARERLIRIEEQLKTDSRRRGK